MKRITSIVLRVIAILFWLAVVVLALCDHRGTPAVFTLTAGVFLVIALLPPSLLRPRRVLSLFLLVVALIPVVCFVLFVCDPLVWAPTACLTPREMLIRSLVLAGALFCFLALPGTIILSSMVLADVRKITPRGRTVAGVFLVAVLCGAVWFAHSWHDARLHSTGCACFGNMMHIDSAKQQWAMAYGVTNGPGDMDGIMYYMKGGELPRCPLGGYYTIGEINEEPACSIHGAPRAAHDGSRENFLRIEARLKDKNSRRRRE